MKGVVGCRVMETTLDENTAVLTYQENVLPGVSGEVIPTFAAEVVPSCREECQSNKARERANMKVHAPVSQLLPKLFNIRLLWKRPHPNCGNISEQEWPEMLSSEAYCQRSPCAASRGPSGHVWDASATLVGNVFFKWEQGDMHCSVDLGLLGKHVQHRKAGDAYREGALAHRWDRCA